MRIYFSTLLTFLLLAILISCQDKLNSIVSTPAPNSNETLSVNDARLIYDQFLQQKASGRVGGSDNKNKFEKKLKWQYAQKEKFADGSDVVLVPLDTQVDNYTYGVMGRSDQPAPKPSNIADMNITRKAVIYRQKGKDRVEFLTVVGEQAYQKQATFFNNDRNFTGAMLFHDDDGTFLRGFYYENGKRTATLKEGKTDKNARQTDCTITINYTLNWYYYTVTVVGYGTSDPIFNFGYGQITSYTIFCDMPTDQGNNPPSTGTGGSNSDGTAWTFDQSGLDALVNSYTFLPPPNPVKPRDHLKCFGNVSGSTYQIFMSVDQPIGGSASPIGTGGPDKHVVGHAFLTFQQTQPDGQIIRRSIGFYPTPGGGNLLNPTAPPDFNDDAQYTGGWDVQLQFAVSGSEFMQAIGTVNQYASYNYDLFNRNCSNMCLDALQQAGIDNLPRGWLNQSWGAVSPGIGATTSYPVMGPSIGLLGNQLYNYQSPKVISRSNSGGGAPSNSGSCN